MGSTNYWVAHKTISQKDATMFSLQNRVNDDRVSARDAPFQSDPGSCNSACGVCHTPGRTGTPAPICVFKKIYYWLTYEANGGRRWVC